RNYHLRAPSDLSYVLEGGVVRMAVGRIPASTAAELEGALSKILAQESVPKAGRSLVITDGPRNADAFRSAGETMASALRGGADILDAALVPDAAAEVAAKLPRSDLVTFVGHAWTGGWGGGATLLDAPGAEAMVNARAPFVVTSTCWES